MLERIQYNAEAVLSFFFPERCVVCNERLAEKEHIICDPCRGELRFIEMPECPVCGAGARKMPNRDGKPDFRRCPTCPSRKRPVYFDNCHAAVYYNDPSGDIVKQLKFNRYFRAATFMARMMFLRMERFFNDRDYDFMVPVPLHPRRHRSRGYNQAELIADELSKLNNLTVARELLFRSRQTQKQSTLDEEDRYFNVKGAFSAREDHSIKGKRILLIDDVYTTGNTLNAAAAPLKEAGAELVTGFTFAHA